jgi:hypothetical protein
LTALDEVAPKTRAQVCFDDTTNAIAILLCAEGAIEIVDEFPLTPRKRPHGRVAGALAVRDRTAGDGQLWHAPVTAAATQNFRNALTRGAATSTIRC